MTEPAMRWLWPTIDEPVPGKDCYCARSKIQVDAEKNGYSRAWRVNGQIVSLQRRDGSYLKSIDPFTEHLQPDDFYAMLDECFSHQCFRPAGYHDPLYTTLHMPRVKWTVNALFAPQFAGGWNEAITPGCFAGAHAVYDIQSAYLSALAFGLPDPDTYRHSTDLSRAGLYVIAHQPRAGLPYPFDSYDTVNATADEIDVYGLTVKRVISGVSWSRDWNAQSIEDAIRNLSFWKCAGRMYWGRWAMIDRVEMVGGNTGQVTRLRSVFANLPWAHLILSRIRMRLYHEVLCGDVRHVFTDSIICTRPRRITPHTIGGWKLVRSYPEGVYVKAAGQYGPMFGELDKCAGVPLDKRQRIAERVA